ncbi:MAG: DUF4097 family beta strand repeat-containing protein [Candidatus Zixiibacteriota bacterium]
MKSVCRYLLLTLVVCVCVSAATQAREKLQTFTFDDIHSIDIRTVSGDIAIRPGSESKLIVELRNNLDDPDALEPEVEANSGELTVKENFVGHETRGEIYWTIYVPTSDSLRNIKCNTASGSISIEDLELKYLETESASGETSIDSVQAKDIDLSTASGEAAIRDCRADYVKIGSASGMVKASYIRADELELSTASGNLVVANCQAGHIKTGSASGDISLDSGQATEMELSNASGSIVVKDCDVKERGDASSSSGDVDLRLRHLPSERIEASSASGDVTFSVPQFGENFSMSLKKKAGEGKIKCPFPYDQKVLRYHEDRGYYTDRFVVKRGTGGPDIKLATSSGTIRIETSAKDR